MPTPYSVLPAVRKENDEKVNRFPDFITFFITRTTRFKSKVFSLESGPKKFWV